MKELEDIRDDQIRVIGFAVREKPFWRKRWFVVSLLCVLSVLVLLAVLPECNQAGKGCDQRAYATDIDTQQKMLVILRKLGQQDR